MNGKKPSARIIDLACVFAIFAGEFQKTGVEPLASFKIRHSYRPPTKVNQMRYVVLNLLNFICGKKSAEHERAIVVEDSFGLSAKCVRSRRNVGAQMNS